jgi:hypothetical protein
MNPGWLVAVLSFESRKISVLGCAAAAAIAMPLFDDGVVIHAFTKLVTSNATYESCTDAGTLLRNGAPMLGMVL